MSRALGHIIRLNTTPNVDFIEFLINRGIEWLHEERNHQRLAACLVRDITTTPPPLLFVIVIFPISAALNWIMGYKCYIPSGRHVVTVINLMIHINIYIYIYFFFLFSFFFRF